MKALLLSLFVLGSISANAQVCELKPTMDFVQNKFVLNLEDKEEASNDDEWSIRAVGGNPKQLNCENLIREIKKSGKKSILIDETEIPLQLIHVINL